MAALVPADAPLDRAMRAFRKVGAELHGDADIAPMVDAAIADLRWNDPVAFSVWSAQAIRTVATQALVRRA